MHHSKNKNLVYLILIIFFIGCQGEDGAIGPSGEDGTNGLNSLVNISNEPSGTNCENGGIRVEVGIDNNSNGSLDTDEILSTTYVCNGADGNTSLTSVTTEPVGTNCENGGVKIESGVDSNGDGTLDDTEISTTAYVCNGIDGSNSLTKITNEAAGTNCENGGLKIDSGVDSNGDGTLDDTEISATAYVCNGIDGNNSLTKITSEAVGTNCENGGLKIDTGVDSNSDGTLDNSEITATAYVCNGIDGNDGLIKTTNEPAGANCENGGIKIDSGIDTNGDGSLDDSEITATAYVCNGVDGNNSLTKITSEAAGTNCENGGLKIDTGVDSDADGSLDDSEIMVTAYACNGVDGNVSLVNISDESAGTNCENGGVKVDSGVDDNNDGTLGSDEIDVTRYVCSGSDGNTIEEIRFKFISLSGVGTSSTTGSTSNGLQDLVNFSKNSYPNMTNAYLSAFMITNDGSASCIVDLFDKTNNVAISGSEVSTNSTTEVWVDSGNFIDNLPTSEVDLVMRVRSETDGVFVTLWQAVLVLKRE